MKGLLSKIEARLAFNVIVNLHNYGHSSLNAHILTLITTLSITTLSCSTKSLNPFVQKAFLRFLQTFSFFRVSNKTKPFCERVLMVDGILCQDCVR